MPRQISLREMVKAGIRPESTAGREAQWLVNLKNRRPSNDGAHDFYSITQPMSNVYLTVTLGEAKVWPHPQLFHGKAVTLLAFLDAIYLVDTSSWTATAIDTKDPDTGGSAAITSGKDWHFLDFGETWMLFNGACIVWKKGNGANTYVTNDVTIGTGMVHLDGRALLAGFSPSDFYARNDWPTALAAAAGTVPGAWTEQGYGANWVWASSFFAPDLLWLLDTSVLSNTSLVESLRWRNEAHGIPMPWRGGVYGFGALGKASVVYGEGVAALEPLNDGSYAVHRFADLPDGVGIVPGLYSRGHFAGDASVQYFVDGEDALWVLSDQQARRLGYSEYLAELDRDRMLLTYDPRRRDLYMSDGTIGFLFADGRMCRCNRAATTLFYDETTLSGIYFPVGYGVTEYVTTGDFASSTGWTLGSGWGISGGKASGTTVSSALSQPVASMAEAMVAGVLYAVSFDLVRNAGTLNIIIGATSLVTLSASGSYRYEFVFDGNAAGLVFTGTGFTGNLDNVSVRKAAPVFVESSTLVTESGFVETVSRVRVIGKHSAVAPWQVKVRSRVRAYDDWTNSTYQNVDERGAVKIGVPALEFRIVLASNDQTLVSLDDVIVDVTDGLPDTSAKLAAGTPGAATE